MVSGFSRVVLLQVALVFCFYFEKSLISERWPLHLLQSSVYIHHSMSQYITVYPNHGFRFECFEWFQGQRPAEWDPSALTTIALANASGAGGCRDGSFILEGRLLFTLALQVKSQHIVLPLCCDLRNSCCSG